MTPKVIVELSNQLAQVSCGVPWVHNVQCHGPPLMGLICNWHDQLVSVPHSSGKKPDGILPHSHKPKVSVRLVRTRRWNLPVRDSMDRVYNPVLRGAEVVEDPLTDIFFKIHCGFPGFRPLEGGGC